MNPALVVELKAMVEDDRRICRPPPDHAKKFAVRMSPEQTMEWSRATTHNTDRLKEIVERV
jgi:hypothetical protein